MKINDQEILIKSYDGRKLVRWGSSSMPLFLNEHEFKFVMGALDPENKQSWREFIAQEVPDEPIENNWALTRED